MNKETYIREHYQTMTNDELAKKFDTSEATIRRLMKKMGISRGGVRAQRPANELVEEDRKTNRLKSSKKDVDAKYRVLLQRVDELERERDAMLAIKGSIKTHSIEPSKSSDSEATVVMLASDWHIEESVDPETINGINEHNLEISKERAEKFFRNGMKLTKMFQRDVHIDTLVLALLGDFISNSIHDELMESNLLPPVEAIIRCQNYIASGIEHILKDKTIKQIVIPCHSGNHGRTTKDRRHSTEAGNSLEYFMYHELANHFKNEPRVKFVIAHGYHSYINVYDYTLRFHHGHNINFGGGVGGITIPVNKAIAEWDKTKRADLDCFGHFHQFSSSRKFISNGSQIGYNAYALSIKASAEPPKQALFLVDKKRFVTIVAPIMYV